MAAACTWSPPNLCSGKNGVDPYEGRCSRVLVPGMPFLHPGQASTELHVRLALLLHRSEIPHAPLPLLHELVRSVWAASPPFMDSVTAQAAALSLVR